MRGTTAVMLKQCLTYLYHTGALHASLFHVTSGEPVCGDCLNSSGGAQHVQALRSESFCVPVMKKTMDIRTLRIPAS